MPLPWTWTRALIFFCSVKVQVNTEPRDARPEPDLDFLWFKNYYWTHEEARNPSSRSRSNCHLFHIWLLLKSCQNKTLYPSLLCLTMMYIINPPCCEKWWNTFRLSVFPSCCLEQNWISQTCMNQLFCFWYNTENSDCFFNNANSGLFLCKNWYSLFVPERICALQDESDLCSLTFHLQSTGIF